MSELTVEHVPSIHLSDPLPSRCAGCWNSPTEGVKFVDFDAMIDRGTIVDAGSMAVLEGIDELHLCEGCVKAAAERIDFRPELHAKQLREIRRLEVQRDHHRDAGERAQRELAKLREYVKVLEQDVPISRRRR